MEQANARRRFGASWAFSIAAHVIILFSASMLIADRWLKTPSPTDASTPTIDATLKLPKETKTIGIPETITYATGQVQQGQHALRHRTLSDTQFEPRDKDYLSTWREYIEVSGTQRYQAALKKNPNMKGALTMRVSINPNGTLASVVIEQSSGSKALDQLALQIVKDAAPFKPLPEDMRKDTDLLDILRTWQFD
ncbi:MAG: energy transducer TonB [Gammaproteobacteria bacterium]